MTSRAIVLYANILVRAVLEKLEALARVIVPVPAESYLPFKDRALARIGPRDPDDWPVLACALAADCSIWTEDTDFFGAGVATWTTDQCRAVLHRVGSRSAGRVIVRREHCSVRAVEARTSKTVGDFWGTQLFRTVQNSAEWSGTDGNNPC